MRWLLVLLTIAVIAIHQDNWFWKDRTLVFGFLPIGLAYHFGYSILASCLMAVLVKFAWPVPEESGSESAETGGGAH